MTLWASRFAITFLLPYKVRKGNMGKINQEVVQLRKKALEKKEYLSRLQQLSWRIKKVEDIYPLDSHSPEELRLLVKEYDQIYGEFIYLAQLEMGNADYIPYDFEGEEVQDAN